MKCSSSAELALIALCQAPEESYRGSKSLDNNGDAMRYALFLIFRPHLLVPESERELMCLQYVVVRD